MTAREEQYVCTCDCGREVTIRAADLLGGAVPNCGICCCTCCGRTLTGRPGRAMTWCRVCDTAPVGAAG